MLQETLSKQSIKSVFLDVRGTILSPWDDAPLLPELCHLLGKCVENQINLVIASATSLASTGLGYVIEPLLAEFRRKKISKDLISECIAYVESGTAAYRFDIVKKVVPLEEFEFLTFEENEKNIIESVLSDVCALHGRVNIKRKFKPGQVNCYVGGPWEERRLIADEMNLRFAKKHFTRLISQVPSARETIDIAISTKARIAEDYLRRNYVKPNEILIIGDSLQIGGNDEPLSLTIPEAIAVHVGDIAPDSRIFQMKKRGPMGVIETIAMLPLQS